MSVPKCPRCFAENDTSCDRCHSCNQVLRRTSVAVAPTPIMAQVKVANEAAPTVRETQIEPPKTLKIHCPCGQKFRTTVELAGKKVRCPKCRAVQTVPTIEGLRLSASTTDFGASVERRSSGVHDSAVSDSTIIDSPTNSEADISNSAAQDDSSPNTEMLHQTIAAVLRREAMQSEPPTFGRISGRKFKQLLKTIEENDGYSDGETIARRQSMCELGRSRDLQVLDTLITGCSDPKPIVREAAVTALGELESTDGFPTVLKALLDPEPDVRRAAVTALRRIADMRAVRPLMALTLVEPRIRHLALDAVVKWGSQAVPELLGTLQDRDAGIAINSVIALGRIGDPQAVPELLSSVNYLHSSLLRGYVMESLGLLADKRALSVLIDALGESNSVIRLNAAAALLKIKDVRAVHPLMKLLFDEDEDVRTMAAMALGEIGDSRAATELERVLQGWQQLIDQDSGFLAAVAEAIGKLSDASSAKALFPLLICQNETVLAKTLMALKRLKAPSAVEAVAPLLRDQRTAIRRMAVEVLGLSNEPAIINQLVNILRNDHSQEVRAVAARTLGERKATATRSALEDALRDELIVRVQAVIAIAQILDKRSMPALLAMMKDAAPEVRFHAVQAVGKFADPKTIKAISALLDDDDDLVRQAVIKALEQLREKGVATAEKLLSNALWRDRAMRLVPSFVWNLIPRRMSLTGPVLAATVACILVSGFFLTSSTGSFTAPVVRRGQVAGLTFSGDGKTVAAMRTSGLLECWNVESRKLQSSLPGGFSSLLSHDGQSALLLGQQKLFAWKVGSAFQQESEKSLVDGPTKRLVTNSDGKWGLAIGPSGDAVVWNLQTMQQEDKLALGQANAFGTAISSDGSLVAAANAKGLVTLFDVKSGEVRQHLQLRPAEPLAQLAISPNKRTVVGVGDSGKLFAWNFESFDSEKPLASEPLPIRTDQGCFALQFLPDNQRFIVANEGNIKVFQLGSDQVRTLPHGLNQMQCVAMDSSGKHIAAGGSDNFEFVILDVETGKVVSELDVK